jgi:transcription elongation factor GreB
MDKSNYMTPAGYRRLRENMRACIRASARSWWRRSAGPQGNGDRSENGDYIYGRKRLREIDRRINWLSKRMAAATVLDPAKQPDRSRVFFGATVTLADEQDNQRVVTLVGDDEADAGAGLVGWNSPIARAVRGGAVGDLRRVQLPSGEKEFEIVSIDYPVEAPG